jgi:hypothetical protein
MRAIEFLVEYNRNITAQQVGDRIISAFSKDTSAEIAQLVPNLGQLSNSLRTLSRVSPEKIAGSITPERRADMINLILNAIEAKDPTPNKAYTPWLAKMYAKAGGGLRIEDINRNDMIRLYDLAKKRRMIKPEHADINRFKFYQDFEDTMENEYNNLDDVEQGKEQEQGSASKVYEDGNVQVIVPHDEAASCRYGRGTRWCTAATKGQNYFDQYNRQGPLYILIPKNPKHEGEKYQLHFASSQFMDEDDSPVSPTFIIEHRFPELKEFFLRNEPEIKNWIVFTPDDMLEPLIHEIAVIAEDKMWEIVSEWEQDDDYYYQQMQEEYGDEDGDIDWDKVHQAGDDYVNWNDEARVFVKDISSAIRPTATELKEYVGAGRFAVGFGRFDGEEALPLDYINDVIASIVRDAFPSRKYSTDGGMVDFIKDKIYVKKEPGSSQWNVGITKR